jgi:hypothetical protein
MREVAMEGRGGCKTPRERDTTGGGWAVLIYRERKALFPLPCQHPPEWLFFTAAIFRLECDPQ